MCIFSIASHVAHTPLHTTMSTTTIAIGAGTTKTTTMLATAAPAKTVIPRYIINTWYC